jgi:uncharacterized protein (DUF1778 family)|nr:MAG TPA: plasmid partition protein ParG-helix-helix, dimer, DNA binding, CELL [Caudoviricetes sp.]
MREKYYQGDVSVRATKKWQEKVGMESITFKIHAGSKEKLRAAAEKKGVSITTYIVDAVNAYAGEQVLKNKN